jgi:hypothetical protein
METTQIDEDAVAAADKQMEERANRAKELLSQRYRGLKTQQVIICACSKHKTRAQSSWLSASDSDWKGVSCVCYECSSLTLFHIVVFAGRKTQ